MNGPLGWLFDATVTIAHHDILWREIVGNLFGLASAVGGLRRRVWAWPVGIVGNVLLFTVFLGAVFDTPQHRDLYGQAGRQVFFVVVSVYGWVRWRQTRRDAQAAGVPDAPAVEPRWAGRAGWALLAPAAVLGTVAFAWVFRELGSWGPWADAWIFTGSLLATYGMARGWIEFWLIWIAVDLVGVPLLLSAGYYPSAALYLVYGGVVVYGFVVWWRAQRLSSAEPVQARVPVAEPATSAVRATSTLGRREDV
ncbi:MAG: nicotinamide riboside transporter PnuC [Cellulomonas sp.]|uniref:nicotinamide riboside transporter PnuC n=1 Tax=Cellulomonas TaxID=1707 RepID=UPI0006527E21|nr:MULTISPECIES: nicotinamide riboside transporter PnuC [Cellulomonas]KMM47362.1 membrane protein [Cellulomonas sp. A375-1]MCR6647394.1 nicotinamide riboside transporter PnuC [Cellulomonas sp.]MCR6703375.1 nicotinamide riboside transporter PnuC [Cellulomonas sp.]